MPAIVFNKSLKDALVSILQLNPVSHIETIDDIVTDDDKQLMLNVVNSLRSLNDNLNQLDQPELNLFNRDFYQIFVEFIEAARLKFVDDNNTPIWTDFRRTNIGTFFLQLMSSALDKKFFLVDNIFRQFALPTQSEMRYFFLRASELDFNLC